MIFIKRGKIRAGVETFNPGTSNFTTTQMRNSVVADGGTVDVETFDSVINAIPSFIRQNASMLAMLPTAKKDGKYYAFDNRSTVGKAVALNFTRSTKAGGFTKDNFMDVARINEPVFEFVDSYETEKQALIDSITSAGNTNKVLAVTFLPNGYVTDGSVDYTSQINAAADSGKRDVILPNFPVRVAETGLSFNANQRILFQENSAFWLKPGLTTVGYSVLNIRGSTGITLINPNIRGDRGYGGQGDPSSAGGIGINISGSTNCTIYDPIVHSCNGDGILLHTYAGLTTVNSKIYNPVMYNSGRNGISLSGADGCLIHEPICVQATKSNPCGGIDIEADNGINATDNIKIYGLITWDNHWTGLQLGFSKRYIAGSPLIQSVNVDVRNHFSDNEVHAFWGSWGGGNGVTLHGFINLINTSYNNARVWSPAPYGPVSGPPTAQFGDVAITRGHMNDPNLELHLQDPEINVNNTQLSKAALTTFWTVTAKAVGNTPITVDIK